MSLFCRFQIWFFFLLKRFKIGFDRVGLTSKKKICQMSKKIRKPLGRENEEESLFEMAKIGVGFK